MNRERSEQKQETSERFGHKKSEVRGRYGGALVTLAICSKGRQPIERHGFKRSKPGPLFPYF